MTDPRLDRREHFDERSRAYPVRALLTSSQLQRPRSYTWSVPSGVVLDQGREGACVGFAIAHELAARPVVVGGVSDAFALQLYRRAQQLDPWPGEAYSGTSVLAGMQAAQELGHFDEYRWAFGVDDAVLAIGYRGPVVFGVPWYSDSYVTDERGWLRVSGTVVGGHAIVGIGVRVLDRNGRRPASFAELDRDASSVLLLNSWGRGFGRNGRARVSLRNLDVLLQNGGECVVPVKR